MWLLATLTGVAIKEFTYKKMHGRFARTKKTGCNNEVIILTR